MLYNNTTANEQEDILQRRREYWPPKQNFVMVVIPASAIPQLVMLFFGYWPVNFVSACSRRLPLGHVSPVIWLCKFILCQFLAAVFHKHNNPRGLA
jgi:hypothetical protein